MVLAGRPFGNDDGLTSVDAGNIGGACMAVRYPLKRGRSTVAGPPYMSPGVDRLRGYRITMAEAGLIVFGDFGRVSAEYAVYRQLGRGPWLDAIVVASGLMAAGALRALRRSGRRVPEDMAVIGFDYSPLARHTDPRLTTVRQPVEAMGERLASELLAPIGRAGQDPVHVVLDTELVIRESA